MPYRCHTNRRIQASKRIRCFGEQMYIVYFFHYIGISVLCCVIQHLEGMQRNSSSNKITTSRQLNSMPAQSRQLSTYSIRALRTIIAPNTRYFSAASATLARISNSTFFKSVGRRGYMYWNRNSSTSESSDNDMTSSLPDDDDAMNDVPSGGANPSDHEYVLTLFRCTLKTTRSQDSNVISESAVQTNWTILNQR